MISRWLRVGIVLVLLLQGFCDTAGLLLPRLQPLSITATSQSQHSATCQCHRCTGGKHCCCLKFGDSTQAAQMRALCDQPEDSLTPMRVPARALAPSFSVTTCVRMVPISSVLLEQYRPFFLGRTPEPSLQPPCSLS